MGTGVGAVLLGVLIYAVTQKPASLVVAIVLAVAGAYLVFKYSGRIEFGADSITYVGMFGVPRSRFTLDGSKKLSVVTTTDSGFNGEYSVRTLLLSDALPTSDSRVLDLRPGRWTKQRVWAQVLKEHADQARLQGGAEVLLQLEQMVSTTREN